jgi:hypothetical protein
MAAGKSEDFLSCMLLHTSDKDMCYLRAYQDFHLYSYYFALEDPMVQPYGCYKENEVPDNSFICKGMLDSN